MDIPVTDAKARLTELVRRAEAGEEIVLTRHGKPAARIVPAAPRPDERARRALIASVRAAAKHRIKPGPTAARSQDFLYDDRGLPGPGRVPRYAAVAATRDEDGTKAPSP